MRWLENLPISERLARNSMPEPNSGCLLWLGRAPNGYGSMMIAGKRRLVHRLSYEVHRGPIPAGMCVCHKCDVTYCINPDHLWLGTNQENTADKVAKKRSARFPGELHPGAKLSEKQVLAIRAAAGFHKDIAARYSVSDATVSLIKLRKTWSHI